MTTRFKTGDTVRFRPVGMRVKFVHASPTRRTDPFMILSFISKQGRHVNKFLFPFTERGEEQTIHVLTKIFGYGIIKEAVEGKVPFVRWLEQHLENLPCPQKVTAKCKMFRGVQEWEAVDWIPADNNEDHDNERNTDMDGTEAKDEGQGMVESRKEDQAVRAEGRGEDGTAESRVIPVPDTDNMDDLEDFFDKQLEEMGKTPSWKKKDESPITNMPNFDDRHEYLRTPAPVANPFDTEERRQRETARMAFMQAGREFQFDHTYSADL